MRLRLVATGLLVCAGCSHAPPPSETAKAAKAERRDDWLVALKSDLERIGASDGFEGQVRVIHGGKAEIDRTFGETRCLPLGAGRRVLATVAVGLLVEAGKLGWDDRLERRLPAVAGTSFAPLTVANLLTDSSGLALASAGIPREAAAQDSDLEWLVKNAGSAPLRAAPGTMVDPADERPWILVEALVSQVAGDSFEHFVTTRFIEPAGMSATSLRKSSSCPEADRGTTTLDDQFRLIEALRAGKLVSPQTRAALWAPRLPLGPGSDVAYGFFVRTRENQQAVGVSGEGRIPAYELWLDPVGSDALVLLGRTPAKTAHGIRTALGEFYALPPGAPQASAPTKRSVAR